MPNSNPDENLDAEGIPVTEDHPPGTDIETDSEAMMAPRDHSVAAGSDPSYPTTAEEQRTKESVAERASREQPDGRRADREPVLYEGDDGVEAADDGLARSAEEAAVHVIEDRRA